MTKEEIKKKAFEVYRYNPYFDDDTNEHLYYQRMAYIKGYMDALAEIGVTIDTKPIE